MIAGYGLVWQDVIQPSATAGDERIWCRGMSAKFLHGQGWDGIGASILNMNLYGRGSICGHINTHDLSLIDGFRRQWRLHLLESGRPIGESHLQSSHVRYSGEGTDNLGLLPRSERSRGH